MGAVESPITRSEHWFTGEDRLINIDVVQADGVTPQDMTGWSLTWELKDGPTGMVRVAKSVGSGLVIGDGAGTGDRASITIADTDTEGLPAGTYYHHLRRTDPGNEIVLSFGAAVLLDGGVG